MARYGTMLTQRGGSGPSSVLLDVEADDARDAITVAEKQAPGLQVIFAAPKSDEEPWVDTRNPRMIAQAEENERP